MHCKIISCFLMRFLLLCFLNEVNAIPGSRTSVLNEIAPREVFFDLPADKFLVEQFRLFWPSYWKKISAIRVFQTMDFTPLDKEEAPAFWAASQTAVPIIESMEPVSRPSISVWRCRIILL